MTIPYFESYNGKRPIVERVEACKVSALERRGHPVPHWHLFPGANVAPDIVAALTRDAIKCWAAECEPTNSRWARLAEDVLGYTDHAEVNAAAHALADALGVEP